MVALAVQTVFVKEAPDHTAAWLAFIGAMAVALLAAATAQWRLRVQLRHEREMADLHDLREVLERYLSRVDRFCEVLSDAFRASREKRYRKFEGPALDEAKALLDEINLARAGISVRVAREAPIQKAAKQISDLMGVCLAASEARDEAAFRKGMDDLDEAVRHAFTTAQDSVGSRLPKAGKRLKSKQGTA